MDNFEIQVWQHGQVFRMKVTHIISPGGLEQFIVQGATRLITIQTDVLLLRRKRLKERKGTWKVIDEQVGNQHGVDLIVEAIKVKMGMRN